MFYCDIQLVCGSPFSKYMLHKMSGLGKQFSAAMRHYDVVCVNETRIRISLPHSIPDRTLYWVAEALARRLEWTGRQVEVLAEGEEDAEKAS